jgi:hypothetical protein
MVAKRSATLSWAIPRTKTFYLRHPCHNELSNDTHHLAMVVEYVAKKLHFLVGFHGEKIHVLPD